MRTYAILFFYGFLFLAITLPKTGWAQETFDPDVLYQDARKLILEGKRQEGRVILSKVLGKYPDYGDVLILMGRSYAWDGKYDSAAIYFEKALIASPTYEDAYIAYIDDLFWSENYERAEAVINMGLEKIGPQSMPLKYRSSRLHYYKEDYKTAMKIANEVFAKEPKTEGLLGLSGSGRICAQIKKLVSIPILAA